MKAFTAAARRRIDTPACRKCDGMEVVMARFESLALAALTVGALAVLYSSVLVAAIGSIQ